MKRSTLVLLAILFVASFLRLYKLDQVPVSLFGDEMDVGYQAYSILKTGRDYSGNFMPIHLQSLAEWRTSLYLYSSVPTVFMFGISPLGVRLPAAVFGILGVFAMYRLVKQIIFYLENSNRLRPLPFIAAFLLAVSPWHIQYSRAGFEVTQMLFCLLMGVTIFLAGIKQKGKNLWLSLTFLLLMPWSYSTAKLFLPLFLSLMLFVYYKDIFRFTRKNLILGLIALCLVGAPIAYSTIFGGGAARFSYISIFGDPVMEPEIGTSRGEDAYFRGEEGTGLSPTIVDKIYHNKITYLGGKIIPNLLIPFSTEFLFLNGDPNPRHSIDRMGEMYTIEIVLLLVGLCFFVLVKDKKLRLLVGGWILLGVIPSSLTFDGGNHATRLILMLPMLIFLVSYGVVSMYLYTKNVTKLVYVGVLIGAYALSFVSYQHLYWVHNPFQSERWWHFGWKEAVSAIKENENQFERVVITTRDEPPWIFFVASYQFDPTTWHSGYPLKEHKIEGFGKMSYIDKYSFGSPQELALYDWGKIISPNILYLASAKEVKVNLIKEPNRTPPDLKLIKAVSYPSGEPVFYLFTKKDK